jgi:hypothetical protein
MQNREKGVPATNGKNAPLNRLLNTPTKRRFAFHSKRKSKKQQIFIRFNADHARKFLPIPGNVRHIFAPVGSFFARQIGGNDAA